MQTVQQRAERYSTESKKEHTEPNDYEEKADEFLCEAVRSNEVERGAESRSRAIEAN